MYTDIFSFNLSNNMSNLMMMVILTVLLQKCMMEQGKMGMSIYMKYAMSVMMFSLMMAVMPGSLIMQGGMNLWFIMFLGLIFNFLSNWSSIKYYKMIPPSPITMMPIIIIIELISNLMRPMSLILRVLINLSIGHIVMYMLIYPLSMIYNLMEMFIYMIQMYIFWTLILIYSK